MTGHAHDADGIRGAIRLLEFILHHEKELNVSQVQLEVDFSVSQQVNLLTVTPNPSPINLTVGVDATGTPVATVSGGVPPYNYSLDPSSPALPDGITFNEDGAGNITLAGTPATDAADANVLLNVQDSGPPRLNGTAKAKVAVVIGKKKIG